MTTVCILYGVITYYGVLRNQITIPPPAATPTCIKCEQLKLKNIERIKKEDNVKDVTLVCTEVEVR